MDAELLRELIEDDELDLLAINSNSTDNMTEEERLLESFYKINEFYRQHGREPDQAMDNILEFRLAKRLSGFRHSAGKIKLLVDLDEFGLLVPLSKPETIDDILNDDELNLLGNSEEDSIFTLRNVPLTIDMPDYVASRTPCDDFARFEPLFKQCQADLQSSKRTLLPFTNEQHIQKGHFFVLRGVMTYIEEVGKKEKKGGKTNARLHCIFENGTESDMLLRSLATECYKNGRRISAHEDRLMDDLNNITDEDSQTGYIYVLKSLSTNSEIAALNDLYKIGFSTVPVEERIKHAEDDPTYLMAPVHLVEVFECFNLNPQKLELLVHTFFAKVCLEVDVFDQSGKRYTPREWFIAPLAVIEETIELILSGAIVDYRYDDELNVICKK